jgi:hypothetical protein
MAGVRFPGGRKHVSLLHSIQTDSKNTQSPLQSVPGGKEAEA